MYHSKQAIKQSLRQVIATYRANPLPTIKPRDIDLTALLNPKVKKILTVTGFRRVGKTYILLGFIQKYGKERCLYINLEDERLPEVTEVLTFLEELLRDEYHGQPLVLLLDEIQKIPGWSEWARRVNESTPYRLIISGSSSKLSSRELPTELRGHALTVPVGPLCFSEFLGFKDVELDKLAPHDGDELLREYLRFGGLPEIVLSEEGVKPLLISDYLSTFVSRDIIERYGLRSQESFEALLRLLLVSRNYTYTKLTHSLKSMGHGKTSVTTVIRYMRWLVDSFFVKSLSVYTPNIKRGEQAVRKSYLVDTYFSSYATQAFSENIGMLMEQAVYLELLKRNSMTNRLNFFYWKDFVGNEVDFLAREGEKTTMLLQVTYATLRPQIEEREITALVRAAKEMSCDTLTLVTWGFRGQIKRDGICMHAIPLYSWLLNKL